jgi:poly-gamma-glutamate synthesis protein (capsule biosynthesis protein)
VNNVAKKKKKRKIRYGNVILFLILIFLIGFAFNYGKKKFFSNDNNPKTEKKVKKKDKKPKEENYKVSVFAVGDALIHNGVYFDADTHTKGSDGYEKYDFHKMFTYIKDIIKDYDLKFYNQETIIGGKNLGLSNYPCFNSPDEIGLDLIDIGFNLVNLTTNHSKDKGITGLKYSSNFWKKQRENGVYAVGSYVTEEDRQEARIEEKNGIKYALLGYATVTNGFTISDADSHYWVLWDKEKAKQDIEKVKGKADVIMVSMHWGTEYTHVPTQEERDIAKYLASLGVNVIIGHHPHVIQPIEFIDDTLVIYSLGNFLSGQQIRPQWCLFRFPDRNSLAWAFRSTSCGVVSAASFPMSLNRDIMPSISVFDNLENPHRSRPQDTSQAQARICRALALPIRCKSPRPRSAPLRPPQQMFSALECPFA